MAQREHTLRDKSQMQKEEPQKSAVSASNTGVEVGSDECHLIAETSAPQHLSGNVARRALSAGIIWDTDLPGFGLRVQPTGHKAWIVKFRERGRQRFVTLGPTTALPIDAARLQARAVLEHAALDGLPARRPTKAAPLFRDYASEFWQDYSRHWKPSTQKGNARVLRRALLPRFGELAVDAINRSDVLRWRDDLADRQGSFNRALPLLAVMLIYAEQLGYRRKGSNPCKGTPRYKRDLPDRFLSPAEYQRLAGVLYDAEGEMPTAVAVVRLLMFTGARSSEITGLRWEHVQPPRLMLPDSKTGAKIVWLNSPALAVLETLPQQSEGLVFPGARGRVPIQMFPFWNKLRRRAALPDVRLHDLRHSFASVAIADGIPLSMIGKLLVHALPETTARYAHLADGVIAEAAERVSGGLAEALGLSR